MNRAIKFRRIHFCYEKKLISKTFWGFFDSEFRSPSRVSKEVYAIDEQFTSLQDLNKKDIYEGDILDNGFKVYFSEDHACFWAGDMPLCHMNSHRYVIGNIYENPELIKQLNN